MSIDFDSEYRQGSVFNKGMSADQFFYAQIYTNLKTCVKNKTLPFFQDNLKNIPRELTTGKVINNLNLIALEMESANKGYNSNIWVSIDDLKKFVKEGIDIKVKPGTKPVLCNKFENNINHLSSELYVDEVGAKSKHQYFVNIDSLADSCKEKLIKRFSEINQLNEEYRTENRKNFTENIKENYIKPNQNFTNAKERLNNYRYIDGLDFGSVIMSHYNHMMLNTVGMSFEKDNIERKKEACYQVCSDYINLVAENKTKDHTAGFKVAKALDAGTWFQRITSAKGQNLENAKKVEEKQIATNNINKANNRNQDEGINFA